MTQGIEYLSCRKRLVWKFRVWCHSPILKRELQNLQRHFCTSTTTAHCPRGSSHIVLLQYWNAKPIFWVRISGQSMLPDGCRNYMSKDRSVAKFVTQRHTSQPPKFQCPPQGEREMQSLSFDASRSLNYFVTCCHSFPWFVLLPTKTSCIRPNRP